MRKKAFENIVGKGENAGPQCFLPYPRQIKYLSGIYEGHFLSS